MIGFGGLVALEVSQSAIRSTVGMAHDYDAFGLVEEDGHADLFQDEVLFKVVARRGEGFGSTGDDDHVGTLDALLLQELSHCGADAVIETAEHGGIRHVRGGRRVEMEDFTHGILVLILTCAAGASLLRWDSPLSIFVGHREPCSIEAASIAKRR